jgi:hypothetical protein
LDRVRRRGWSWQTLRATNSACYQRGEAEWGTPHPFGPWLLPVTTGWLLSPAQLFRRTHPLLPRLARVLGIRWPTGSAGRSAADDRPGLRQQRSGRRGVLDSISINPLGSVTGSRRMQTPAAASRPCSASISECPAAPSEWPCSCAVASSRRHRRRRRLPGSRGRGCCGWSGYPGARGRVLAR